MANEALGIARSIVEPVYRAKALAVVAEQTADPEVIQEALETARTLEDPHERASVLLDLAGPGSAQSVQAEALSSARGIQIPMGRASMILKIARTMVAPDLIQEAFAIAQTTNYRDRGVCALFANLSGLMAEFGLLEESLILAREINEPAILVQALVEIAEKGPSSQLFEGAIAIARGIEPSRDRPALLRVIAQRMGSPALFQEALAATRKLVDPLDRIEELSELAKVLNDPTIFDEALATARGLPGPGTRAENLAIVADRMDSSAVFEEAIAIARSLPDPSFERDLILRPIVNHLAGSRRGRDASRIARQIHDLRMRDGALFVVAGSMAESGLTQEAVATAEEIYDRMVRDVALAAVVQGMAAHAGREARSPKGKVKRRGPPRHFMDSPSLRNVIKARALLSFGLSSPEASADWHHDIVNLREAHVVTPQQFNQYMGLLAQRSMAGVSPQSFGAIQIQWLGYWADHGKGLAGLKPLRLVESRSPTQYAPAPGVVAVRMERANGQPFPEAIDRYWVLEPDEWRPFSSNGRRFIGLGLSLSGSAALYMDVATGALVTLCIDMDRTASTQARDTQSILREAYERHGVDAVRAVLAELPNQNSVNQVLDLAASWISTLPQQVQMDMKRPIASMERLVRGSRDPLQQVSQKLQDLDEDEASRLFVRAAHPTESNRNHFVKSLGGSFTPAGLAWLADQLGESFDPKEPARALWTLGALHIFHSAQLSIHPDPIVRILEALRLGHGLAYEDLRASHREALKETIARQLDAAEIAVDRNFHPTVWVEGRQISMDSAQMGEPLGDFIREHFPEAMKKGVKVKGHAKSVPGIYIWNNFIPADVVDRMVLLPGDAYGTSPQYAGQEQRDVLELARQALNETGRQGRRGMEFLNAGVNPIIALTAMVTGRRYNEFILADGGTNWSLLWDRLGALVRPRDGLTVPREMAKPARVTVKASGILKGQMNGRDSVATDGWNVADAFRRLGFSGVLDVTPHTIYLNGKQVARPERTPLNDGDKIWILPVVNGGSGEDQEQDETPAPPTNPVVAATAQEVAILEAAIRRGDYKAYQERASGYDSRIPLDVHVAFLRAIQAGSDRAAQTYLSFYEYYIERQTMKIIHELDVVLENLAGRTFSWDQEALEQAGRLGFMTGVREILRNEKILTEKPRFQSLIFGRISFDIFLEAGRTVGVPGTRLHNTHIFLRREAKARFERKDLWELLPDEWQAILASPGDFSLLDFTKDLEPELVHDPMAWLAYNGRDFQGQVVLRIMVRDVLRMLHALSGIETKVLWAVYGLDWTQAELGRAVGLTRARVSQLAMKALGWVQHPARAGLLMNHSVRVKVIRRPEGWVFSHSAQTVWELIAMHWDLFDAGRWGAPVRVRVNGVLTKDWRLPLLADDVVEIFVMAMPSRENDSVPEWIPPAEEVEAEIGPSVQAIKPQARRRLPYVKTNRRKPPKENGPGFIPMELAWSLYWATARPARALGIGLALTAINMAVLAFNPGAGLALGLSTVWSWSIISPAVWHALYGGTAGRSVWKEMTEPARVTVKASGILKGLMNERDAVSTQGWNVADAFRRLGFSGVLDVTPHTIYLNGKQVARPENTPLNDGDKIWILPVVGGGSGITPPPSEAGSQAGDSDAAMTSEEEDRGDAEEGSPAADPVAPATPFEVTALEQAIRRGDYKLYAQRTSGYEPRLPFTVQIKFFRAIQAGSDLAAQTYLAFFDYHVSRQAIKIMQELEILLEKLSGRVFSWDRDALEQAGRIGIMAEVRTTLRDEKRLTKGRQIPAWIFSAISDEMIREASRTVGVKGDRLRNVYQHFRRDANVRFDKKYLWELSPDEWRDIFDPRGDPQLQDLTRDLEPEVVPDRLAWLPDSSSELQASAVFHMIFRQVLMTRSPLQALVLWGLFVRESTSQHLAQELNRSASQIRTANRNGLAKVRGSLDLITDQPKPVNVIRHPERSAVGLSAKTIWDIIAGQKDLFDDAGRWKSPVRVRVNGIWTKDFRLPLLANDLVEIFVVDKSLEEGVRVTALPVLRSIPIEMLRALFRKDVAGIRGAARVVDRMTADQLVQMRDPANVTRLFQSQGVDFQGVQATRSAHRVNALLAQMGSEGLDHGNETTGPPPLRSVGKMASKLMGESREGIVPPDLAWSMHWVEARPVRALGIGSALILLNLAVLLLNPGAGLALGLSTVWSWSIIGPGVWRSLKKEMGATAPRQPVGLRRSVQMPSAAAMQLAHVLVDLALVETVPSFGNTALTPEQAARGLDQVIAGRTPRIGVDGRVDVIDAARHGSEIDPADLQAAIQAVVAGRNLNGKLSGVEILSGFERHVAPGVNRSIAAVHESVLGGLGEENRTGVGAMVLTRDNLADVSSLLSVYQSRGLPLLLAIEEEGITDSVQKVVDDFHAANPIFDASMILIEENRKLIETTEKAGNTLPVVDLVTLNRSLEKLLARQAVRKAIARGFNVNLVIPMGVGLDPGTLPPDHPLRLALVIVGAIPIQRADFDLLQRVARLVALAA